MKKRIALILASLLLGTSLCVMPVSADSYDVDNTYDITGYDENTSSKCVIVYPNNTNTTRVIGSSEYGFRNSKLLIFDKNGTMNQKKLCILYNIPDCNFQKLCYYIDTKR